MKDGSYDIRLNVDGFHGVGELAMRNNIGRGGASDFGIEITMGGAGPSTTSALKITMHPSKVQNLHIPHQYAVAVTGSSSIDRFALLGIGPIGLIVELLGELRHVPVGTATIADPRGG